MDFTNLPYIVEPMRLRDIRAVMEIEHSSFPAPWSARAYRREIRDNALSHYFVVRQHRMERPELGLLARARRSLGVEIRPPILGYSGFWLRAGEAHVSTIAVHPAWRQRGIGELLLVTMLDRATELEADMATLEVRVSNTIAQNLYCKYGFRQVRVQRRYYHDSGEDAMIMSTERLTSANFQSHFQQLKRALQEKLVQALDKML
ncbi:MAG: ribosomal protein S18-alanine N-acetyltransferase [Anaerolineales bacterium]|nr:ribosomal protein S18-alanine N-acetyltransferase [Anaerolineales bacterium]